MLPIEGAVGLLPDGLCLFVHVQFSSHKLSQSYGDMQILARAKSSKTVESRNRAFVTQRLA